MSYQTIRAEHADRVLTITLDRPHAYNAFTPTMGRELVDALKDARRADDVRVVVMTGAGAAFCSGQDLRMADALVPAARPPALGDLLRRHYHGLVLAMRRLDKPIVASINGVAAGAGMSLALACDLRIASTSASFVQAFVNIGLVPDCGSLYFLPRIVGLAKALELSLLGERVDAQEALRVGLVSRVVPADELAAATAEVAGQLANGAGLALGLTKRGLNRAFETDLDGMLEQEALLQEIAGRTSDFREGVTAFKEKREPEWAGR